MAVIDRTRFADFPLMAKLTRWGVDFHMGVLFGLPNQLLLIVFGSALCDDRAGLPALVDTPPGSRSREPGRNIAVLLAESEYGGACGDCGAGITAGAGFTGNGSQSVGVYTDGYLTLAASSPGDADRGGLTSKWRG